VHCIRNGAVLGVVAIKLGLPVNLAKSIIGGLAGMTGCSGIVDMNKIQLSNETQFLVRNIGK
jgi:phosphate/sulfate permease